MGQERTSNSLSCCLLCVKVVNNMAKNKGNLKRKRNRKNKKLKRTEQQQQLASSWTGSRLPCEAALLDYAAEAEAHVYKDAVRTAIAEHEKSKALWTEKERKMQEAHDAEMEYTEHLVTEKERKMQEAHDAELEYTEHLVRPFYMSFFFGCYLCLCLCFYHYEHAVEIGQYEHLLWSAQTAEKEYRETLENMRNILSDNVMTLRKVRTILCFS